MAGLAVIGVGNIAGAILEGVLSSGYLPAERVYPFDVDGAKTARFTEKYGVLPTRTAADAVSPADYILIAVKPGAVEGALSSIASVVAGKCVISVAAGVTLSFIESKLPSGTAVVRAMPNTPLMYGKGAVAYSPNSRASEEQARFVEGLFGACGYVTRVDESLLDSVTALSGSSPAFVFRFLRELVAEGVAEGLPEDKAKALAVNTLIGSGVMFAQSPLSADELIKMVASPGGTTEAGLRALDAAGFDTAVRSAVNSAYLRSRELSR